MNEVSSNLKNKCEKCRLLNIETKTATFFNGCTTTERKILVKNMPVCEMYKEFNES